MVGAVAALALLSGFFYGAAPAPRDHDLRVSHSRVDGWRLEIRHDRFVPADVCTLRKANMVYAHGVLTFQFGHRVDTAGALFRIDDGPAQPAGSVALEAAGLGARFNGPDLSNPSHGEVHIPADTIGQAFKVSIKPNSGMAHRSFNVTGLSSAIEAAKAKGCDIT